MRYDIIRKNILLGRLLVLYEKTTYLCEAAIDVVFLIDKAVAARCSTMPEIVLTRQNCYK